MTTSIDLVSLCRELDDQLYRNPVRALAIGQVVVLLEMAGELQRRAELMLVKLGPPHDPAA